MYTSTRKKLNLTSKYCIEKGLSDDGGLFIKSDFGPFDFDESFLTMSYPKLAKKIFAYYFDDFTEEELDEVISKAYNKTNFKEKTVSVKSFDDVNFLELYYGPTLAFKDMALTILPHLMSVSKKANKDAKKTLILTATSGDTGGAALSGFLHAENTKVIVLYPTKGVSSFQEAQMQYYTNENCKAISVEGNFDDCQNLVKKIFSSGMELKNYELSSANSINIGRLVPQVVYYFYSYTELVNKGKIKFGDKVNYVVPTGNFGDILACYLAKKMGLPVNKLVCASNENKVLTDFFNTKEYNKNRDFKVTYSPAMDILISSNLERLIYFVTGSDEKVTANYMNQLKETGVYKLDEKYHGNLNDFMAYNINNDKTLDMIKDCYDKYDYLIDPHTAIAYGTYLNVKDKLDGETIIVSTASPFKFIDTMNLLYPCQKEGLEKYKALADIAHIDVPDSVTDIINNKFNKVVYNKEEMEEKLLKMIGEMDNEG